MKTASLDADPEGRVGENRDHDDLLHGPSDPIRRRVLV
jgi:hypothetical protein